MNKKNNEWVPLLTLDHGYTLLYNSNSVQPYNVAFKYNAEANEWASGNYTSTLDDALTIYLERIGNKAVKTRYQREVEEKYNISYDRMTELATKFKDIVEEYDAEYLQEYADFDLTDEEMEFLGIELKGDDEDADDYD